MESSTRTRRGSIWGHTESSRWWCWWFLCLLSYRLWIGSDCHYGKMGEWPKPNKRKINKELAKQIWLNEKEMKMFWWLWHWNWCVCVVNWDWASQLQAVVVLHLISMDSFLLLWEEMQTWVKGTAKCLISGELIHYHQGLTSVTLLC